MKKSVSRFATLLILCSLLVTLPKINMVEASGTIYIRADRSVEGTDKIQRDENVYTFTGDIFDSIVVEKDDVVIDGAGYTLNGTGSETGISLTNRSNVTIRNIEIKAFSNGISLNSSSWNTIYGNIIVNNSEGIAFCGCVYNTVFDNVIAYNSDSGIFLAGSSFNRFFRNDIVDNHDQVSSWFGGSNIWDNGSVGNYWSNYNGTDTDNDGIGDEPYFIPIHQVGYELNATDNYPLMNPVIIPEFPNEEPPTEPPPDDSTGKTGLDPTPVLIAVPIVLAIILGVMFYRKRRLTSSKIP